MRLRLLMPDLKLEEDEWRWTSRSEPLNLDQAFELLSCVICLDDEVKYCLVELPCNDHFCLYCFKGTSSDRLVPVQVN